MIHAQAGLTHKGNFGEGSLQLCVLVPGLFEDGNVGVGVFPQREEIFVGGESADAGGVGIRALRGFRLQSICASHAQMR